MYLAYGSENVRVLNFRRSLSTFSFSISETLQQFFLNFEAGQSQDFQTVRSTFDSKVTGAKFWISLDNGL